MSSSIDGKDVFAYKRALEGLRNGVPNAEAVKILGCNQPQAERHFNELLSKAKDLENPLSGALGMLVSGDFGAGKSHLLSYLEQQALSQGFVCSRVAISKETPLYDVAKVFRSAVDHARIPDRTGQLMEELGLAFRESSDAYSQFFLWADSEQNGLHRIFPATLMVHERLSSNDLELVSKIRSFWAGDRIAVKDVRDGLKAIEQSHNYPFRAPKVKELPPQRLRFATELIRGAGYNGWVVLLDEVELIGSYTLPQRAKSYAELARWLGEVEDEGCPGLVVVGTVTSDFAAAVLGDSGKQDRHNAAHRLRSRGDDATAARAETGMRVLEREAIPLEPPSDEDVNATIEKLRRIHSVAYTWDAPRREGKAGGAGHLGRMRYKVRAAINEWDLLRLFPDSRPETEGTELTISYEEQPDLEKEVKDDESEDD